MEKYENILKGYLNLDSSKISFEIFTKMVGGIYENIPSEINLEKFLARRMAAKDGPDFLLSLKNLVGFDEWDKERIDYCQRAFDDPTIKETSPYYLILENDKPISMIRFQRTKQLERGELHLGGIKRKSSKHLLSALLLCYYVLFNQDKFGVSSIITRRKEADFKSKHVLDFNNLESDRKALGNAFDLIKTLSPTSSYTDKDYVWNVYALKNCFTSFEQILEEVKKIQF